MCVAAIAWRAHPRWRLVAIGNRDEYHQRPTAPLAAWDDGSGIIAGKDLQAGGTWLGITAAGRFSLLTNFRVEGYPKPGLASRGGLVTGWLRGEPLTSIEAMNPFNICLADSDAAQVLTNYPAPETHALAPGVHGLSNGAFHRPWPKTRQLCTDLESWLAGDARDFASLFAALRSEALHAPKSPDEEGPDAPFSPVFIRNALYGTRCSTVVAIDLNGRGTIAERRFSPDSTTTGDTVIDFG